MARIQDITPELLQFAEAAAPDTPAAGVVRIYAKSDGLMYSKDDAGAEHLLGGALDAVMTTEGDILYRGSAAPARLAIGTAKHVLRTNAGATAPEWVANTRGLAYYLSGDLAADDEMSFIAPCALTVTNVKMAVGTAPTDANLIVDIHKNGTTIFTTQDNRPTIVATETTEDSAAPDVTSIAAGDKITLIVDQVGSTIAGADLSATIICEVT